ncbi:MAG: Rrf2 family transcriptional regulator [Ottowia sp.]|jgi:Rrf2 family nitric oxide-sensitive transcriptional repressor|nr:Rrf2 family transcriptional regulator [Ottowia sp.]
MQLTLFTDMGLRTLMYLSHAQDDRSITIAEISARFHVPRNHLTKVVQKLSSLKWVDATRGRNGGLCLGHNVWALGLGTIIKTLEGDRSVVNCTTPPCVLAGNCQLKHALDLALQAFHNELDKFTLQDLMSAPTTHVLTRLHKTLLNTTTTTPRH